MSMASIIDYILNNKEWIFSGIGILAISVLAWIFRRIFSSNSHHPAHQEYRNHKLKVPPVDEEIICQKAEAEFRIAIREFKNMPISKQQRNKIEENINRDYSPYSVLDRAIDIRIDIFIMPLVDKLIKIESELRFEFHVPFTHERIENLRKKFINLVIEDWSYIITESYDDAIEHVTQHAGQLFEYKEKELNDRRQEALKTEPTGLYDVIDENLQKVFADSILNYQQFQRDNG